MLNVTTKCFTNSIRCFTIKRFGEVKFPGQYPGSQPVRNTNYHFL